MSDYRIQGATGEWEVVIGLEVHAQVTSNAKLFSGASTEFGAEPNSQVSLVDAAMPGMLPVPNARVHPPGGAHRHGARGADQPLVALRPEELFLRRSAAGLSDQPALPPDRRRGRDRASICEGGATKTIGIERIHVEQDAGKLMHDQHPTCSYVDLNRSGVALMEIVSRPDMRSPEEAGAYVRKLQIDPALCRLAATAIWSRARCAPTSTCQRAQAGRRVRHPHRDQERQFGPLHHGGDRA